MAAEYRGNLGKLSGSSSLYKGRVEVLRLGDGCKKLLGLGIERRSDELGISDVVAQVLAFLPLKSADVGNLE